MTALQSRLAGVRQRLLDWVQAIDAQGTLTSKQTLLFLLVCAVAITSRRPSLLEHAQFYAEDGAVWYSQAYNTGWLHSLTLPEAGYLNTLQRLVAGLCLYLPLGWVPLAMAIAGTLLQVLPVAVLISPRCRTWGPLSLRLFFAALYVTLPNSSEIHVVLTNSQWHLALAEILLAFSAPPRTWFGRLVDLSIFLVGGFTGPFALVIIPLLLVYGWLRRQSWSFLLAAIFAIGGIVQALLILHAPSRLSAPLGATPGLLLRLFGGDVLECMIFGSQGFIILGPTFVFLLFTLLGISVYVYCLRYANLELGLFIIFSILIFAASMRSPLISGPKPLWQLLLGNNGARYWFFPMLTFIWGVAWCARFSRTRTIRLGSTILLFLSLSGVVRSWHYHAFADKHFNVYVDKWEHLRPGDHLIIPIAPDHHMELIKKAS